jgi:hypothetical protein
LPLCDIALSTELDLYVRSRVISSLLCCWFDKIPKGDEKNPSNADDWSTDPFSSSGAFLSKSLEKVDQARGGKPVPPTNLRVGGQSVRGSTNFIICFLSNLAFASYIPTSMGSFVTNLMVQARVNVLRIEP